MIFFLTSAKCVCTRHTYLCVCTHRLFDEKLCDYVITGGRGLRKTPRVETGAGRDATTVTHAHFLLSKKKGRKNQNALPFLRPSSNSLSLCHHSLREPYHFPQFYYYCPTTAGRRRRRKMVVNHLLRSSLRGTATASQVSIFPGA